jgi:hypothetical protein
MTRRRMVPEDRQDPQDLRVSSQRGESAMAGSPGNVETRYDVELVSAALPPMACCHERKRRGGRD